MSHLSNRPLIMDFGMHLGEDSEFYLALGAKVIAFEANDALIEANRRRFRSEIASGQLEIIRGAITAPTFQDDHVVFYVDRNKSVWGTTKEEWVTRNAGLGTSVDRVDVPAVKLSAILARNDVPYYIKIDIEGADQDVLATLLAAKICPDYLSIESSKTSLSDVAAEIELLRSIGFNRFAAVQQGGIPGSTYRGTSLGGQRALQYRFRQHSSGRFGPFLEQDYKNGDEIMDEYARIFRRYRLFGDTSWLMRNSYARLTTRVINKVSLGILKRPLCGWFDTHACR
jgi:FkbM family methyltransferase